VLDVCIEPTTAYPGRLAPTQGVPVSDVPTLVEWIPNLTRGLGLTVLVTVLGALLMFIIAVTLGFMARSHRLLVRGSSRVVIEFFRGTSLLVQLWWLYFALPLLGIRFDPLLVAVLALGMNYGAYGAEVVRGSINAVPKPQWEAATALSLSRWQRMRRVVWPQALALMIPSFNNLFIQLLKSTPLLFTIALVDLMTMGENFRFAGGDVAVIYPALLVIYFVLTYAFTFLFSLAEIAAKKRLGQHEGFASVFRDIRRRSAEEVQSA
jgi:polar amino acid transport system permease protein